MLAVLGMAFEADIRSVRKASDTWKLLRWHRFVSAHMGKAKWRRVSGMGIGNQSVLYRSFQDAFPGKDNGWKPIH